MRDRRTANSRNPTSGTQISSSYKDRSQVYSLLLQGSMPSLLVTVFILQLAIHLINTIGASSINDLVWPILTSLWRRPKPLTHCNSYGLSIQSSHSRTRRMLAMLLGSVVRLCASSERWMPSARRISSPNGQMYADSTTK